jgi:hypothetical protein
MPPRVCKSRNMFDWTRELVAYAIIGCILLVGTPILLSVRKRRKRERLRRRGIKTYGH